MITSTNGIIFTNPEIIKEALIKLQPYWLNIRRCVFDYFTKWEVLVKNDFISRSIAMCRYCQRWTDRYLLLGNSSCIALISYIHVTMQYLHFHHPWWSYQGNDMSRTYGIKVTHMYRMYGSRVTQEQLPRSNEAVWCKIRAILTSLK